MTTQTPMIDCHVHLSGLEASRGWKDSAPTSVSTA